MNLGVTNYERFDIAVQEMGKAQFHRNVRGS